MPEFLYSVLHLLLPEHLYIFQKITVYVFHKISSFLIRGIYSSFYKKRFIWRNIFIADNVFKMPLNGIDQFFEYKSRSKLPSENGFCSGAST